MLRSICGWRRIDGENQENNMRRIKQRVQVGMMVYYVMSWEERLQCMTYREFNRHDAAVED